jgi:hypothetical protein
MKLSTEQILSMHCSSSLCLWGFRTREGWP